MITDLNFNMNCLKTFSLSIAQTNTYDTPGVNVRTWGTLNKEFWEIYSNANTTTKSIVGFKNINIYKVKMIGGVGGSLGANSAIVQDYSIAVILSGQPSLIGGTISPNAYNVSETDTTYFLNKFNPEFNIPDGIKSVSSVSIRDFSANGYGAETASAITLGLRLDFIFYYDFQEE